MEDESCHWLQGSWIFKPQIFPSYVQNLSYGEQQQHGVQAIGNIAIIMQYPREFGPMKNFFNIIDDLTVIFEDL